MVDAHGVVVPGADKLINLSVTGQGRLAGVDNGRQESAEGYQVPHRTAYQGKALAIVHSTKDTGRITLRATSPGLLPVTTTLRTTNERGGGPPDTHPAMAPASTPPAMPAADAGRRRRLLRPPRHASRRTARR